jgi:hypothetical protein
LAEDRQRYPEKTHNEKGELKWHLFKAKDLLRWDLEAKSIPFNQDTGRPDYAALRNSRPEYAEFSQAKLRQFYHQEVICIYTVIA